jgi:hypothetical protein
MGHFGHEKILFMLADHFYCPKMIVICTGLYDVASHATCPSPS